MRSLVEAGCVLFVMATFYSLGSSILPVLITQQPSDQLNVVPGTNVNFFVSLTALDVLPMLVWRKDSVILNGADQYSGLGSTNLTVLAVNESDEGLYVLETLPDSDSLPIRSRPARLTVLDPPKIITQPASDLFVSDGEMFQLTVVATGNSSLNYRWQRFSFDIFDRPGIYNGTGTNTLTVLNVSGDIAGLNGRAQFFTVNVSNLAGSIISSASRVSIVTSTNVGAPGIPGEVGEPGPIGMPGVPGEPGEAGSPGPVGDRGIAGVPGFQGPRGQKGESGVSPDGLRYGLFGHGIPGRQGPQGFPGIPGPSGPEGQRGSIGLDGKDGRPGIDGLPGEPGPVGPPAPPASPPGGVFTVWGANSCNGEIVYSGIMSSSIHNDTGGASNYLCMPNRASYGSEVSGALDSGSGSVTAVEFTSTTNTIECGVCFIPRSTVLMIPGNSACPLNWTTEYSGYLMSQSTSQERTEYVCVQLLIVTDDMNFDTETGAGGRAHFVTVECDFGFNCDQDSNSSYLSNRELSCVVCSR